MNRKIKTDDLAKKKRKRNIKVARAIVGISLDDIKKMKSDAKKTDVRKAIVE